MEASHSRVLLGMGANLGDPAAQLRSALAALRETVELEAVSSLYRTQPLGYADQPDFLNLVCAGRTKLSPAELLEALHRIELELGRVRPFPNAPRSIDLDLLDYDGVALHTPTLVLPHPRMHERAFVLEPLVEIAPQWRHPRLGRSAAELLDGLGAGQRVERLAPAE